MIDPPRHRYLVREPGVWMHEGASVTRYHRRTDCPPIRHAYEGDVKFIRPGTVIDHPSAPLTCKRCDSDELLRRLSPSEFSRLLRGIRPAP
jgi:hypothetical protein